MSNVSAARARQVFLILIAVNAIIAIGAILGVGSESDTRWQVLGTSSVISAASLLVAANAATLDRAIAWWLPAASTAAAIGAGGLTVIGIWFEGPQDSEAYWKTVGVLATVALAGAAVGLLGLPRLRDSWRMAQVGAQGSALWIAAMIVVSILREDEGSIQAYGVAAVLFAATTIVVLVGARTVARERTKEEASLAALAVAFCPRCGTRLDAPTAATSCGGCGLTFRVEVIEDTTSVS
jgi:ribosomal protein S27AE